MTDKFSPESEKPYLVGGNLLNEQDEVAREKQRREQVHEGEQAQQPQTQPAQHRDLTEGGTRIPDQPAENIAEQRQTHGGGMVPPGDAGAEDETA